MRKQNYTNYINSNQWRHKRQNFLEKKKVCSGCGATLKKLDVHHTTYERFGREFKRDLVAVCRGCHNEIHNLHKSQNISLQEATERICTHSTPLNPKPNDIDFFGRSFKGI